MKRMQYLLIMGCTLVLVTGCAGGTNNTQGAASSEPERQEAQSQDTSAAQTGASEDRNDAEEESDIVDELLAGDDEADTQETDVSGESVYVTINGNTYLLVMEPNVTAQGLLTALGERDLNLPIYNFEGFEGSDVYQYYDIPTRYEVEGNTAAVSSERAGEVYYEEPNRLLLFYRDAEISGNYTLVGHIDDTGNLADDVIDNPVVEGWGNKIISVRRIQ